MKRFVYKNKPIHAPVRFGHTNKSALLLLFLYFCCSSAVEAQSLARWLFGGSLSGTPGSYNTAHNITLGSAIGSVGYYGTDEFYGEDGWPAGALSSNAYMQFRMAPLPGHSLNIASVTLRLRRSQTGLFFGSGPTRWALRSSLDNYAANIATGTLTTAYQDFEIATGSTFMGLTGQISFRLYGYQQSTSLFGENRFFVDDISVYGPGTLLPLKFTHFSAAEESNGVQLRWSVAEVLEGTSFIVEHSQDGTSFTEIGRIEEKTSYSLRQYEYTVYLGGGKGQYYRIRSTEPSGAIRYSQVARLSGGAPLKTGIELVWASAEKITTSIAAEESGVGTCMVYSTSGALMAAKKMVFTIGSNRVSLPVSLPRHGSYILTVYLGDKVQSKQFIY